MNLSRVKLTLGMMAALFLLQGANAVDVEASQMRGSNVKYFYVFGASGSPYFGATGNQQIIFMRVPSKDARPFRIEIFDPDTAGGVDEPVGEWNTVSRFSVFGGKGALTGFEPGGGRRPRHRGHTAAVARPERPRRQTRSRWGACASGRW